MSLGAAWSHPDREMVERSMALAQTLLPDGTSPPGRRPPAAGQLVSGSRMACNAVRMVRHRGVATLRQERLTGEQRCVAACSSTPPLRRVEWQVISLDACGAVDLIQAPAAQPPSAAQPRTQQVRRKRCRTIWVQLARFFGASPKCF
jgi:hypothetical protein